MFYGFEGVNKKTFAINESIELSNTQLYNKNKIKFKLNLFYSFIKFKISYDLNSSLSHNSSEN